MEYLLLSGLLCEATWFADKMGDWKAGLLLSVACINHRVMSPKLYKKLVYLSLSRIHRNILLKYLTDTVYCKFKTQSGQTKDYKIGICLSTYELLIQ